MTIKLASTRANLAREEEGDWQPVPEWPGVRLKVRAITTPSYRVAHGQLLQKWSRKYGKKLIPPEEQDREFGRLFAAEILRGWEGFDQPYTPESALEEMVRPDARDLRKHVEWAAGEIATVRVEFEEEGAKN